MGLITKEVEVNISGVSQKYYENLGYKIPRYWNESKKAYYVKSGTSIQVKVCDLPKHSKIKIMYTCNNCKTVHTVDYESYCKSKHQNENACYCQKCILKLFNSGENHPLWNDKLTESERINNRDYPEYTDFVKRVLVRDNYTCQCCGNTKSNTLEVHHLDGYNWCKEKRTDDTNGITLCNMCHGNFHNIYGYGENTKEQFGKWIGLSKINLSEYNGELPQAKIAYCVEDNLIINSVSKYCKTKNIQSIKVYECCNGVKSSAYGKHYVWYDNYLKMSETEINLLLMSGYYNKQIICINDKKIFKNAKCASKYFNTNRRYICDCCNNKMEYILKENQKLYFKYLEKYMEDENISNISELKCEFIFDD